MSSGLLRFEIVDALRSGEQTEDGMADELVEVFERHLQAPSERSFRQIEKLCEELTEQRNDAREHAGNLVGERVALQLRLNEAEKQLAEHARVVRELRAELGR